MPEYPARALKEAPIGDELSRARARARAMSSPIKRAVAARYYVSL